MKSAIISLLYPNNLAPSHQESLQVACRTNMQLSDST